MGNKTAKLCKQDDEETWRRCKVIHGSSEQTTLVLERDRTKLGQKEASRPVYEASVQVPTDMSIQENLTTLVHLF